MSTKVWKHLKKVKKWSLDSATIRLLPKCNAPRWELNRKPFTQQT